MDISIRFVALRGRVGSDCDCDCDCDCACDLVCDFVAVVVVIDDDDAAADDGLEGDVDEVVAAAGFVPADGVVVEVEVAVEVEFAAGEFLLVLAFAFALEVRLREGIVVGDEGRSASVKCLNTSFTTVLRFLAGEG